MPVGRSDDRLARIGDAPNQDPQMSLITAIVVVVAWTAAAFAAGAWHARPRDLTRPGPNIPRRSPACGHPLQHTKGL